MHSLIGAWRLVSSRTHRDDESWAVFGEPPAGQLQYTSDHRMSGFLMDPKWAAGDSQEADGLTEFFSYAGVWSLDGDLVHHHVEMASHPKRIGTEFYRKARFISPDDLELTTIPEVSKSGKTYQTVLLWRRMAADL